jgi:hypothetical protein
MIKQEIEDFKHDLKSYNELKKGIEIFKEKLKDTQYQLERVGGGVVKVSKDQPKEKKINYDLYEKKTKYEYMIDYYNLRIKEVHDFIEWLEEPYKSVVKDLYIHCFKYDKVAMRNNFSGTVVYKIIDKEIKKYIEKYIEK